MIPFVPIPLKKAIKISKRFSGLGSIVSRSQPHLKLNLYQSDLGIKPVQYSSIVIFTSLFYFVVLNVLIASLGVIVGIYDIFLPLGISTVFSIFVFSYILNYPKFVAKKRMNELERNLVTSLDHLLIEIKSGISLFNAMVGISEGYGEVSKEFRIIIKEINSGRSEVKSLEEASRRNPSLFFRRAMWQLVNALRAGSDIGKAMESIVESLSKEQLLSIKKYGQELNPLTMMYMLIAVIMPSLGVTFLIILSSFTGIVIPKIIFPIIVIALSLFQFFYLGIIKTKRPAMEV